MSFRIFCIVFSLSVISHSQTITGTVLDYSTHEPMESVSVYFDNSTIGTITDADGRFSLSYSDAIQSPLILSFLGYQKVKISNYRDQKNITVELKESLDDLAEVVINADDGLTRLQKLKVFKREFLGRSKFARSCKILNEDDLIFRYYKKDQKLNVSAKAPIVFINESLQYEVSYDINVFEIDFSNVAVSDSYEIFDVKKVTYSGTVFYKKLEDFDKRTAEKNREKAFEGSVLEFIRAAYHNSLKTKNYKIYDAKYQVNPNDYIVVETIEDSPLKRLSLPSQPITIVYDNSRSSMKFLTISNILIDAYGNYSNPTNVEFTGAMANQRLGDLLPIDYNL